MASFAVTLTVPATNTGGSPTISWTLPSGTNQTHFQIGAYRSGDRSDDPLTQAAPPPFDYQPVAASGHPALPYGVVPDPEIIPSTTQQFTFGGGYPATRGLPNGTYIIWVHIIEDILNDEGRLIGQNSGVATGQIVVSGSTIQEPRRLPRTTYEAPPPPVIVTPVEGAPLTSGAVSVAIQFPAGITHPRDIKIAIYQSDDWDEDRRRATANPVRFTDRGGDGPGRDGGAEWVPIDEFLPFTSPGGVPTLTVVFGASVSVPDEVPNSPAGKTWVMAVKYNTEQTAHIISFDERTGFARVAHMYHSSEITVRSFTVTGSVDDYDQPDPFEYTPTAAPTATWPRNRIAAEVGGNLDLRWQYHNSRGVGQRSVQVRRILNGGTNAGTRYLSQATPGGAVSWVTALDTTGGTTDIAIRTEHLQLSPGTAVGTGWGGLTWGTHQFAIRPTSEAGTQGDWSNTLTVDVYRRLTISNVAATVTGGFIVASWSHDGATGNNRQARYRVQIYEGRRFVSGTSDRPETRDHARAVIGDDLSFTLNRTAPALGPVPNGTYRVRVTIWDRYGNQDADETTVTVNNTAPTAVAVTPRVYDHRDMVQPGTSGLIPGEYVGVAFGTIPAGLHAVRLERQDFSRTDGRELAEASQVAFLPLGTSTSLARFNDYQVDHGAQYEYRAVAIAANGAEADGAWTP